HSAMWGSDDAVQWTRLEILTPMEGYTVEENRMLIWHEFDPNSVTRLDNGEYVALCAGGNRASGGVARVSEIYEIYLAADGRTLTRESRKLLITGGPGEDDAEELASPTTLVIRGERHLLYVGAKAGGQENTVMGAVGSVSTAPPDARALDSGNIGRHIYRA
ncbi:MAG: hypothetical protein O3B73_18900, partial [bacterium]|nr:hypothetical protein [bacterium]